MILYSTMCKLQAKDADIFVLTVDAYTMKKGLLCNTPGLESPREDTHIPEWRRHFATFKQAEEHKKTSHFPLYGMPEPVISSIKARSIDAMDAF